MLTVLWKNTHRAFVLAVAMLATASHAQDPSVESGFVHVSRDAGDTWDSSRPIAIGNISVSALLAVPGGKIFAGMTSGELLRSDNHGSSWQSISTSLPAEMIHSILVDPADSNRILVVVGDAGVFQSLDGGQNFEQGRFAGELLPPAFWPVRDIAFVPADTSKVLAGSSAGLFQSVDGGYEFSSLQAAAPISPPPTGITAYLNVSIEDRNGSKAVELGTNARFRVTVRNDGPEVSSDTFVHFNWVQPDTNGASSLAFTLSSNAGSCIVARNSDVGCSVGTLSAGQSATINFDGTISTSFIGEHQISVTARNAQGSVVVANDSVASKRTVACVGDCGGSAGLFLLVALTLLALRRLATVI